MVSRSALIGQVNSLLSTLEGPIKEAFEQSIQNARNSVDLPKLIAALQDRDVERAMAVLNIDASTFFPLEHSVQNAYVAAGSSVAAELPRAVSGAFGFNGRHVRAEAFARDVGSDLIQGIKDDTLTMARRVITQGLQDGTGPQKIATELVGKVNPLTRKREGGFIGLTDQQREHIDNARAILSDPERIKDYFTGRDANGKMIPRYKLSDRRFDSIVKRAILKGEAVSKTDLERMMVAHKNKALKYRGELIAKNEAFTAQARGRNDAYLQVMERPDIETVTVRWQHNLSVNPRPDHVAMNGTTITLGQTFDFPDAQMKYPHDPVGGAHHSNHCRCIAVYRVRTKVDESSKPVGVPAPPTVPESVVRSSQSIVSKDRNEIIKTMVEHDAANPDMVYPRGRDDYLKNLIRLREGEPPSVDFVDEQTFKSLPGDPIWRGIEKEAHLESNFNSDWTGLGVNGNGNYHSSDIKEAGSYSASDGWVYAAKLKPDAKIIEFDDIYDLSNKLRYLDHGYAEFNKDPGRTAAIFGYDAIRIKRYETTHIVVLNNRALVVNKATLPDAVKPKIPTVEQLDDQISALKKDIQELVVAAENADQTTREKIFVAMDEKQKEIATIQDKFGKTFNRMQDLLRSVSE